MKRFCLTLLFGTLLATVGAATAQADYGHPGHGRYGGHSGHGHAYGHSGHSHNHGGYGYQNNFRYGSFYRGPVWHNTTHYDYHAPSLQYHRGHYDYVPGHYDLHRSGHWDW